MDTEAGGEANTSQSRHKKGHMMNIYLTASDDEAIVDFVKDHEALYNKNKKGMPVGKPTATSCLSKSERFGSHTKGHTMENSPSPG